MDVKVLKAVVHGDAALFAERPELMEAKVWVHFHSSSRKYNRIECWGRLREATTRRNHLLDLDLDGRRLDQLQSAIITKSKRRRKWATPETIFNALLALLL
jgi:proteinaceous RNase P